MRQSKREVILEAAQCVVQRGGVTALTYESVAAEAELTKGGLLYHFPTRENLLQALHEYVAGQWEAGMVAHAGAPADQVGERERFAAYVQLSHAPERAELLLQLEGAEDVDAHAVWDQVQRAWSPSPPAGGDWAALHQFIAKLAADGLWFYEALNSQPPLDPATRAQLVAEITKLGAEPSPRTAEETKDADAP